MSSREGSTVLSCTGVLVVGGTSVSERGKEAPKSLDVLGVIEVSANIGSCECECEFACVRSCVSPSFYRPKEGRITYVHEQWSRLLPPESGENSWRSLRCGAWRRAWLSSLEAFDHAGNVYLSCGVCGRRGNSCRARYPLCLTGRSTEGASDDGLVLVNSCTVSDGRRPWPPRVLQRREYNGLAAQWWEQC